MIPEPVDPGDGLGLYVPLMLSNGMTARVSPEDYGWASKSTWTFNGVRSPYAARRVRMPGGGQTKQYLHRLVLVAPPTLFVNHRNGQTLDCRRGNLNATTPRRNSTEEKVRRGSVGYFGVDIGKPGRSKPFRARISLGKKQVFIGHFATAVEAATAYDHRAVVEFGLHAITNFPLELYVCPGVLDWGRPKADLPDYDHLRNVPF